MNRDNFIPWLALGLLAVVALYLLGISGHPRMADGVLDEAEMYLGEKLLSLAAALCVFGAIAVALRRAYKAGSWFWFLVCLFCWPATFVYTLAINRSELR